MNKLTNIVTNIDSATALKISNGWLHKAYIDDAISALFLIALIVGGVYAVRWTIKNP